MRAWHKATGWINANPFPAYASLGILFIHFILSTYGVEVMNIDRYPHLLPQPEMRNSFWTGLLYYHTTPVGLSLIYKLMLIIGTGDAYRGLAVLLPLLHVGSFLLFYQGAKGFNLGIGNFICAIIFFNPLLFVYFKYPYTSCYLFFSSCALIFFLSRLKRLSLLHLYGAVLLICCCGLLRSTFHPAIIGIAAAALIWQYGRPQGWWAMLFLIIPLSGYLKNYIVFGRFMSSSYLGHSLGRTHISWAYYKPDSLMAYNVFSPPSEKGRFIDTSNRLLRRHPEIAMLHRDDWHDVRHILLGEKYTRYLSAHISPRWSANMILNGVVHFCKSPAQYFLLYPRELGHVDPLKPVFNYDWFCPTKVAWDGPYWFLPMPGFWEAHKSSDAWHFITSYMIVYSAVILAIVCCFLFMPFEHRWLVAYLLFFTVAYIVVDPHESNRMRMEIEPLFYFFSILLFQRVRSSRWPWQLHNPS